MAVALHTNVGGEGDEMMIDDDEAWREAAAAVAAALRPPCCCHCSVYGKEMCVVLSIYIAAKPVPLYIICPCVPA